MVGVGFLAYPCAVVGKGEIGGNRGLENGHMVDADVGGIGGKGLVI